MPHADTGVVKAVREHELLCIPGVATPTEAFAALDAGAHALKLFPAEMITPDVVRALRAVLPASVPLLPVGGITPERIKPYLDAGAKGFGLGSALYSPGITTEELAARARRFVDAWQTAKQR
jgi:2-dehydro-3-deoxyphosphogalactonate aldolase